MDVVDITILGSKKQIENKVAELGIAFDFSKVKIISPIKSEHYEDYVNTYYELRKKKNVTLGMAKDLMEDGSYFGTMMVYKGQTEWFLEQPIRRNIRFYQHYNLLKQNPIHLWFLRSFYVLRRPSFCFWDCA
jgi:hypothetical protein